MKSPTMLLIVMGTVGAVTLASTTADAQRIQRFDDSGGDSGESAVHLPGAPAPEPVEQEVQYVDPPGEESESDGEGDETVGSYRISVHGEGAAPGQRQRGSSSELLSRDHTELYRGVIPGKRDDVEHLRGVKEDGKSSARPNPVTWVGFQPDSERTRVFFQSPRPVQYQLQEAFEEGELVVIFDNATIPERNFSRFIDASHFDRAVKRIEAEETRDGNVKVTLTMRENVEPSISTDGEYLYLDFPHTSGSRAQAD